MPDTNNNVEADATRRTILVVGAGYGGLRFFVESLHGILDHNLNHSVRYVFVDGRPESSYGRGVAWASDQNPNMRANMHLASLDSDPRTQKKIAKILTMAYNQPATASELFERRKK